MISSIIVFLVLVLICGLAVRSIIKDKKSGKSCAGCSGKCGSCETHCHGE